MPIHPVLVSLHKVSLHKVSQGQSQRPNPASLQHFAPWD
jgi:hypothetical protein